MTSPLWVSFVLPFFSPRSQPPFRLRCRPARMCALAFRGSVCLGCRLSTGGNRLWHCCAHTHRKVRRVNIAKMWGGVGGCEPPLKSLHFSRVAEQTPTWLSILPRILFEARYPWGPGRPRDNTPRLFE